MSIGVTQLIEPPDAQERRRRPRIPCAVDLKLHAPKHHFVLLSQTVDLSSQGAFVRSNRALPIGTPVNVELQRGESRNPLRLEAEVVRTGTPADGQFHGVGLRFINLTQLDESILAELIAQAAE